LRAWFPLVAWANQRRLPTPAYFSLHQWRLTSPELPSTWMGGYWNN